MDNKQTIKNIKEHCYFANLNPQAKKSLDKAIASLEAWDKVKKEMLSQSIIKTHTESYASGFSDGLERAFDIIQDIIEEYLEGE